MNMVRTQAAPPRFDSSRWPPRPVLLNKLSRAEFEILIGQDPNWCPPRSCPHWELRMDATFDALEREREPRDLRHLSMETV